MSDTPPKTRPRMIFESSDGVTVMYGEERCTELELLEAFFAEKLVFGNPPYRVDVEAVPADRPMVTTDDVLNLERTKFTYVVIRMDMRIEDAAQLSRELIGDLDERGKRLAEQIWLRSVFVEQRRRVRIPERPAFDARCDGILEALDPVVNA